jgi:hypothetical protein
VREQPTIVVVYVAHRFLSSWSARRRASFARRHEAEQKTEIMKLAEVLKKSELGGLVRAMKVGHR